MKTVKKIINKLIDELDEKNKLIEMQNFKIRDLENLLIKDSIQIEKDKAKEVHKDNIIKSQAEGLLRLSNLPTLVYNDKNLINYLYFDNKNNFLGYLELLTLDELEVSGLKLIWERKN